MMGFSQGPSSCACVWSDSGGVLNCSFGNCGGQNWGNCYNQVSTPNLWQTNTCPDPPSTNCDPYMWNTGLNGSCWYQGAGCSGEAVCDYVTNPPLPVELVSFTARAEPGRNVIEWETSSELNSAWFHVVWHGNESVVLSMPAAGTTTQTSRYKFTHYDVPSEVNIYSLIQVDIDGVETRYAPISVDNRDVEIVRVLDMQGRELPNNYRGLGIVYYSNGEVKIKYK